MYFNTVTILNNMNYMAVHISRGGPVCGTLILGSTESTLHMYNVLIYRSLLL